MMNKNLSEEKKKYEREFCDLLIQRISDAGGSLQFQHLSGIIQQARFEIRDAFGNTKSELMKFLRGHPKIFQIDSSGTVTISNSTFSGDDNTGISTDRMIKHQEISHRKIEKGIGCIIKISHKYDYGIIEATNPIKALVHFKSTAFFKNKDYLLSDSPLQVGDEVYFHAELGHDDIEVKYKASKVWQKLNEREDRPDPPVSNQINGKGNVKNINADYGFIFFKGKREETIFFHITSVKDCDCKDLTNFLKNGECVEFFATEQTKDSRKSKWQATSVRKISQIAKSLSHTNPVETKLENEPGKIYPNSTGAIIKFGKNFTEQADGNRCSYFLYGGEVTDIQYEFSEGDDIFFDAVKSKSSKWKANLVWVGEKPVCYNYKKTFLDDKIEVSNDESVSSKASSMSHSSKPMTKRSQSSSKTKMLEQNEISNHSTSRRHDRFDERPKKQNLKLPNSESFSTRKSRNESGRNINKKDNLFVNRRGINKNRRGSERKIPSKVEQKKSLFSKNTTLTYESDEEVYKTANNFKDHHTYKGDYSNSSQDDSDDSNQGKLLNNRYLKKAEESCLSAPRQNISVPSDNDMDNTCNEIKSGNNDGKKMASIKKFDDVEGKIVNLHCKAAIIECSCLQNSIDFMLNAFYLNGKSVEEQQVIDLKEVLKVGDVINFNCFKIIDDDGDVHQKVTMAWKGPKPEVYEMTPEEFISEFDLSVTINKKLESNSLSGEISSSCSKNILRSKGSESSSSESSSESESEEVVSDDKDSGTSNSDSIEKEEESEEKILDVNKAFSEIVLERLRYKRLIPTNVQVDFSGLLTEVSNLVHNHCDRCDSAILNESKEENPRILPEPVCSLCEKTLSEENKDENHTSAQTIITGGIIAQSIYTQP